jgi:hypothetical protein
MKHFFLDNGILKVIKDLPERPTGNFDEYDFEDYQSALKAAKRDAIEVVNQDEVVDILWDKHSPTHGWDFKEGEIYSLECEMTLKYQVKSLFDGWNDCTEYIYTGYLLPKRQVALITFSESKPMNEEKDYCGCSFVMIMRDAGTGVAYCSQCRKEVDEKPVVPPFPVEDKEEWSPTNPDVMDVYKIDVQALRATVTDAEFRKKLYNMLK